MSDIVLRTQVAAQIKTDEVVERISNRLSREEGQANFEYAAILLFVAAVAAAVIGFAPSFAQKVGDGFDKAFSALGL